jgi:hypothetical protein
MNHRATRNTALAAAVGLAVGMAAAPVMAQEYGQQQQPQADAVQVDEAKINQFVDALVEISTIRQTAAAELESAEGMEEAQKVQQDAQQRMLEAVESAGLSVEEYNHIASLMGSDPELAERINSELEKRS